MTGADVVAEARTWLGTRFHHQGSLKGAGCDCVGLVLGVGKALGIYPQDLQARGEFAPFVGYARRPSGGLLESGCTRFALPIPAASAQPGDVLLFRFEAAPTHVGIIGDYPGGGHSIIHAYLPARKVIETRLDATWAARVTAAFRLPGVTA